MPDFDRLHELASRLAKLTAPEEQEPGLASWCIFVGENWQQIANMWGEDPKRAAAAQLYAALERAARALRFASTPEARMVHFLDIVAEFDALLAKARGETS